MKATPMFQRSTLLAAALAALASCSGGNADSDAEGLHSGLSLQVSAGEIGRAHV